MASFGGFVDQRNEGLFTMNWLSSEQRNIEISPMRSDGYKVLGRQANMPHDIQNAPACADLRKTIEDNTIKSLQSHNKLSSSNLKITCGQDKADLSALGFSTHSNLTQEHASRDTAQVSLQNQQSAPLIRPIVKSADGMKNVEGLFPSSLEKSRVMVQEDITASSTVLPALKNSAIHQLTSWAKWGPCVASSGLSCNQPEHMCNSITQQGMSTPNATSLCQVGSYNINACSIADAEEYYGSTSLNPERDPSKSQHVIMKSKISKNETGPNNDLKVCNHNNNPLFGKEVDLHTGTHFRGFW